VQHANLTKRIVAKRVRELIQIRNHIRLRVRVAIEPNGPRIFIVAAADV